MATDLISSKKLIDAIKSMRVVFGGEDVFPDHVKNSVILAINVQPAVDAEPVRHGRWSHEINNLYGCSECFNSETMSRKRLKPYCPNCGAKMDGGKQDA